MKHLWKWMACALVIFAATTLVCAQESLGDVARQERARPKPHAPKVITNDDIPSVDTTAAESTTPANEKTASTAQRDDKNKDKDKPLSVDEKIKQLEMWKSKIAAQETKVESLDKEVQEIDRNYRLRMSAYYADLGMRLRNEGHWAEEEKKYHEDIAIKQKQRDAERDKLEDMKDAARRAGVNGID